MNLKTLVRVISTVCLKWRERCVVIMSMVLRKQKSKELREERKPFVKVRL